MAYNLLGQQGTKGQRNPDPNLSDAEATYLYDTPPGFGDNKGLTKTSFGTLGPADKRTHNKKLQEVGIEPELEKGLSSLSFAEKEQPDLSLAVPNVTNSEFNNIKNEDDIAKLANEKNFTENQLRRLRGSFGKDVVNEALGPQTLQEETDFIRNRIAANKKTIIDNSPKTPSGWASLDKNSTEYKMFTTQAAVEADKIINNLGIEPTSFEAKAFKAALTYGGSDAVEKLFPSISEPLKTNETTDGFTESNLLNTVNESLEVDLSEEEEDEVTDDNFVNDTNLDTQQENEGAQQSNQEFISFVNIPTNALLFSVDNDLFIAYEVPGLGTLYEGSSMYLAYEVPNNNLVDAGILPPGMAEPTANLILPKTLFDKIAVVTGNTDQLTADIDNPFASFVETISEQAQVAPWITDPEMLELIAEAAVEGRTVSDAEWQTTNWYQTHSEPEREWLRTFYADPSTAAQTITDGQIAVGNALQAAGVSNAPEALVNWIADKFVTGQWTQNYTTEQISLFADPYAEGKRDTDFESYLTSTAITGVDRTSQREAEVRQLYSQYLGPVLGKITDGEAAEIAGKLRNDPDYRDQLVAGLKQSRLAAFSAYTNPELTYEDIARPWRNLTASVWGQTADETQGWWQDMIKTNDFAQAEETLRTKGLELDITQVTQDATTALTQALGQGNISQSGVNV